VTTPLEKILVGMTWALNSGVKVRF
jgi:hypothetical protein